VSDETSKKQDADREFKLDNDLDVNVENDESVLFDIDSILNQEDPDFLNQLSKIKIDAASVDLSVLGQGLALEKKVYSVFFTSLRRPFEFKNNTKTVIAFWTIILVVLCVLLFVWKNQINLFSQKLFLTSYAELGSEVKEYNPNNEVEPFYDNPRFSKNLVTITSMHVNIKPSENSGPNPMLALEITTEGLSADAIIEIKDREAEFKDKLLRITEEKTYDDLVETAGKLALCEQFRDALNASLTRGQVRKVLLKSFVIKP
jgi:flagellar basal body-associated protein FliL